MRQRMKAVQPMCPTANDHDVFKPRLESIEQPRERREIIHVDFLESED